MRFGAGAAFLVERFARAVALLIVVSESRKGIDWTSQA